VFYLADVLQPVVHGLYHRPLSQQDLAVHRHKAVFHFVAYAGDHLYTVRKKYLYQFLGDITLIGEQLAEYLLQKPLALERFEVVLVGLCDNKIQYPAPVVDHAMQLEAIEPPHGGLGPTVAMPFKTLFALIRLSLQALIGVEPTKDIPPGTFPKQQDLRKTVIGSITWRSSSTNLL